MPSTLTDRFEMLILLILLMSINGRNFLRIGDRGNAATWRK